MKDKRHARPKSSPPPQIKPSRRAKHAEWVRSWRRRVAAARERGRERRRLYGGKPLRIYDVAYETPEGDIRVAYVEGVVDEAGAVSYVLGRYAVADIVRVIHTGYLNPPPERPGTMPDGKPKLELKLDELW
ncbi:hypothetical protein GE107_07180 [Cohnella sp. CFH 77786]|uniref:hypothetical protein n=1 Tax=Cohnella sp. CFH 77786 TaxID=2662265 RepID=UPI001C60FE13|nr:hypothetical protein [Cohnella sp. CFH 77786]MBW5445841.1 hypothetical protein [Cohnella sp. CFH 77786]